MIISIDGGAATGKTTVAKTLSKKINFIHLNSGLIYRALTYIFLENNFLNKKTHFDQVFLNNLDLKVQGDNLNMIYYNSINISSALHSKSIAENIKYISDNVIIRKFITQIQRNLSKNKNVVCEGRDIGSIVFPYAELKFFLECDIDERVERRYNQYLTNNIDCNKSNLKKMILNRDKNDMTRINSPLIKVKESILINTTDLKLEDVIKIMCKNI